MRRPAGLLVLALLLAAGCGERGEMPEQAAETPVREWPPGLWEAAGTLDRSSLRYHDLPGVEGFAELPEEARLAALAAAHLEPCPCGCADHSVAFCLNEDTGCLSVVIRARELVAEAEARLAAAAGQPAAQAGEGGGDQDEERKETPNEDPAPEPGAEGEEQGAR